MFRKVEVSKRLPHLKGEYTVFTITGKVYKDYWKNNDWVYESEGEEIESWLEEIPEPDIEAKLKDLQKTPIPGPFIHSDKSPQEIAEALKNLKPDKLWLKGFKSGAYWYENELKTQSNGKENN